jgi:hypothetical protein
MQLQKQNGGTDVELFQRTELDISETVPILQEESFILLRNFFRNIAVCVMYE